MNKVLKGGLCVVYTRFPTGRAAPPPSPRGFDSGFNSELDLLVPDSVSGSKLLLFYIYTSRRKHAPIPGLIPPILLFYGVSSPCCLLATQFEKREKRKKEKLHTAHTRLCYIRTKYFGKLL